MAHCLVPNVSNTAIPNQTHRWRVYEVKTHH